MNQRSFFISIVSVVPIVSVVSESPEVSRVLEVGLVVCICFLLVLKI